MCEEILCGQIGIQLGLNFLTNTRQKRFSHIAFNYFTSFKFGRCEIGISHIAAADRKIAQRAFIKITSFKL